MYLKTKRDSISKFFIYLFLILITAVFLFPFYWMIITAVKPLNEIFTYPPKLWPSVWIWNNFAESMKTSDFLTYFKNSIIVTVFATIITVLMNLLAGYAFAKYDFKFKNLLFMIVLSTLMIPMQVTMIPNFIIISRLNMANTYIGLILPMCAEAYGLFLSRQFISEIPDALLQAGRIDGASEFRLFTKIIIPNVRPLISVLVIFTVMWRWNDFQWPLIIVSKTSMYTVQLGLALLKSEQYTNWNYLMSATLISILPIIIVFLIFQKQFVQGIASTGIKG